MRVLVACEFSGIVREAFKAKGHDAWSWAAGAGIVLGGTVGSLLAIFITKRLY